MQSLVLESDVFQKLQPISCPLLASSLPEGEHEIVTHSDEGGGGPLGLAQRVPLKETRVPLKETREIPHTKVRGGPPGVGGGGRGDARGNPPAAGR